MQQTRTAIIARATACDLQSLASLASEDFTYSFGGGDDPEGYWRTGEADGRGVLADLVYVLQEPTRTIGGVWTWPAITGRRIRPEDVEDLAARLDEPPDALILDGAYIGPRVGIDPQGGWVFYISGD